MSVDMFIQNDTFIIAVATKQIDFIINSGNFWSWI